MELLISNISLSWLCLTALFAFVELFFLRYRVVWISVGSTVGLLLSLMGFPLWLQISVFFLSTVSFLWFSRNWVRQVRCNDVMFELSQDSGIKDISVSLDDNFQEIIRNSVNIASEEEREGGADRLSASQAKSVDCENLISPVFFNL